jgi:hypothetical protein
MNFPYRGIAVFLLICCACLVANAKSSEVTGPYANRLNSADVVAIKAAVSNARGISHSLKKIEAVSPDKVAIQTATRTAVDEDTTYDFKAYKRSGTWTIDLNSVQVTIDKRDFRTHGPDIIR